MTDKLTLVVSQLWRRHGWCLILAGLACTLSVQTATAQPVSTAFDILKALYESTDGDNWTDNTGWDITRVPTAAELDTWYGIDYDGGTEALRGVLLRNNNLVGPIPSELGSLSKLELLDLSRNAISGTVPASLGNLSKLRGLNLGGNNLSGTIPSELGNLANLERLTLLDNAISGTVPAKLGNLSSLIVLSLGSNNLSGKIPSELGDLLNLEWLSASWNDLSGTIPSELGNLSKLRTLVLGSNDLSGTIPSELGNLLNLEDFSADYNELSGPLPSELGNLSKLEYLYLHSNQLSGPFPDWVGALTSLQGLLLDGNNFSGGIPSRLGDLVGLTSLRLNKNPISGTVPGELGNASALEVLRLDSTSLSGSLPTTLTQLSNLSTFYFDGAHGLCAPADSAFQTWLNSIPDTNGSTCAPLDLTGTIANQTLPRAQPIAPLVLPEASGGVPPINYTLAPTLPTGLSFDSATRTISGTPTEVTQAPLPYTYTATDMNGSADSLHFTIEVFSPVDAEYETLPESFAVQGHYPNPFRELTRIVFDLPWPARVTVEVMDVTGRRVLAVAPVDLAAGWAHNIAVNGITLPSGLYLYRLMAVSPESHATYLMGRFVHVR